MMACTIKEFIICPRIITFHVIQKSSVKLEFTNLERYQGQLTA